MCWCAGLLRIPSWSTKLHTQAHYSDVALNWPASISDRTPWDRESRAFEFSCLLECPNTAMEGWKWTPYIHGNIRQWGYVATLIRLHLVLESFVMLHLMHSMTWWQVSYAKWIWPSCFHFVIPAKREAFVPFLWLLEASSWFHLVTLRRCWQCSRS